MGSRQLFGSIITGAFAVAAILIQTMDLGLVAGFRWPLFYVCLLGVLFGVVILFAHD